MIWWMTPDADSLHTPEYYERWAPDLYRDPVMRFLDKYHFVFPILSALTLYAIGGMPLLVWGFFVRTVLVLHTTWLVNSATHVWGYRTPRDARRLDQPLVGGAPDLRRRLAQQPPRLSDLRRARYAAGGRST